MLTTANYEGTTEVFDRAGGIERVIPFQFTLMLAPDVDEDLMPQAAMALSMFLSEFYREEEGYDPNLLDL